MRIRAGREEGREGRKQKKKNVVLSLGNGREWGR